MATFPRCPIGGLCKHKIYIDVRTNRTFVYTKDGTKYYLARDNAYFNKNYKTGDAFELCKLLTHLTA